ncbi:MAG: extracellular solute-binding protein [Chloroflexi bacterium]|nr:extracellular solute-binding protein [Chloroflexota bacterium]
MMAITGENHTRSRRGFLAGSAAVLASAVAAACATPVGDQGELPPKSKEPVQLQHTMSLGNNVADQQYFAAMQPRVAAALRPHTVNYDIQKSADIATKFLAQTAAGTPPDTIVVGVDWARDAFERGLLETINAYVGQTPALTMSKFLPSTQYYNQAVGKFFGVPGGASSIRGLTYNAEMFQAEGINPRREATWKWTWDDLVANVNKLTKRGPGGEIVITGLEVKTGFSIVDTICWFYANGAEFYAKDEKTVVFNSPKGQQAFQFYWDQVHKYQWAGGKGNLDTGEKAMTYAYSGKITSMAERAPQMKIEIMPFPKGPGGAGPATMAWTDPVALSREGKRKAEAWEFLKALRTLEMEDLQIQYLKVPGTFKAFYEQPAWKEMVKQIPALTGVQEMERVGRMRPVVKASDIDQAIGPVLNEAMKGATTPKAALAESERLANGILAGRQ